MSWKDLDIKLKAELIKLGVLSGIRDIKLIRLLYDDNNTPTLVVELSYNETNVMPLLGIERIKLEYDTPEEEINKANDIIQLIENEISLEEINNQLPILFRLFNKGGYVSNNPTLTYSGGGPIKRKRENSLDWRMAVYNAVDPRSTVKNIDDAFRLYNAAVTKEKRGEDFKDYTLDNTIGDLTSDAAWRKRLLLPYDETLLPVWNGDTVSLSRPLELEIPIDTNLVKDRIDYAQNEFWNDVKSLNLRQLKEDLSYKKSQEELLDALRYTYKTGKPIGVSEYHANSIDPEKVLKDFKYGISPLNVLGRYNIRYDKDENKMYYSDEWDFNLYEWAVPGTTFRIRGAIPLDKKKNGGKVKKYSKGGYEEDEENTIYTAGYSEPITVIAKKELSKRQQMQANEEWREYLKQHPIQIGSEEYNRLPEKAKAQVYKNSITNAIDKAALPTAAAIIAPTALTAGAASLVGSGALTAAADAVGKVGTKIAETNLGKAANVFINNPYVNLGLTGLGAYFVPQHFKNGVDNIKTGNYVGALGDFGMIGLETLGAANTAKLLTNSVKGIINPLFANPYSPNTLTRVIGTGTSGLDDAINSGIIRGNPNGGINTAKKLNRQQKTLKAIGVPKKTIDNYLSNNLSEKDYEILKKYIPEWFSDTETVFQVNGLSFSLGKKGLPTKYEDYIKEYRSTNPLFKNKTNFNPLTEQEVLLNWEGVPEPTFALSPDLSKKYGFKTENVLNSNLFKGDYAILIKNAETHGTPLTLAGHLPEHWTLKYPMEYNHPDVTFYKRLGIPFINKNIYYKIDPLKYSTIPLNENGGFLFPNLAFSHKFEK